MKVVQKRERRDTPPGVPQEVLMFATVVQIDAARHAGGPADASHRREFSALYRDLSPHDRRLALDFMHSMRRLPQASEGRQVAEAAVQFLHKQSPGGGR